MSKALNYIALAKKAGSIQIGETNTGATTRNGKTKLLILAQDSSDNAKSRADGFIFERNVLIVRVPFTKEELSAISGVGGFSMAAFTDIGFAAAFMKALSAEDSSYEEAFAEIDKKKDKANLRRKEALAHDKNKKFGKATKVAATSKRRTK